MDGVCVLVIGVGLFNVVFDGEVDFEGWWFGVVVLIGLVDVGGYYIVVDFEYCGWVEVEYYDVGVGDVVVVGDGYFGGDGVVVCV